MSIKSLMGNLLEAFKNKHGVLVASWKASDGSSWYRKYSDGWIEQGGIAPDISSTNRKITLPLAFSSTGYAIVASVVNHDGNYSVGVKTKTTTTFSWWQDYGGNWIACGN